MERDDLVKRVRDDTDRRAIRVMVSEKGKELFETALAPSRELVYQVMSCYNEDDVSRLSELLQKVRSHTLPMLARGNGDNMAAVPGAVRTDSRQIESK